LCTLVEVNGDRTFTVITDGLDRPTSLEFIGNTAHTVTLIWQAGSPERRGCLPLPGRLMRRNEA